MLLSLPALRASVSPGAGTGCERVCGVVALGQVAERERGVTGAQPAALLPVPCK